jgi:hypothetical protein
MIKMNPLRMLLVCNLNRKFHEIFNLGNSSFRPDCTVDAGEARAAAASRRASRAQTRESSLVPVEEIGRSNLYVGFHLLFSLFSREFVQLRDVVKARKNHGTLINLKKGK